MTNCKFWMVVGQGSPTYHHASKDSAKNEAERLARTHPNHEFTVLESLATVTKSDLRWDVHETDRLSADERAEIPF